MKINKIRKYFIVLLVLFLGVVFMSGCSNSDSNPIEDVVNQGSGYVEGYIYKTTDGNYVFNKTENGEPATNAQVKIDGTIYDTNNEGYFKTGKIDANKEFSINIVVPIKDKTNFAWSSIAKINDKETLSLSNLSKEKNWNMIFFISDKADSLDAQVSAFMDDIEQETSAIKNVNFFIIYGKYLLHLDEEGNIESTEEKNRSYYLTGNGKRETFDYGYQNFGDPDFYREQLIKINEEYPAKNTMVSVFSHGNGWNYMETPGENPFNWMSSDTGYADRMDEKGEFVMDFTLDTHELYNIFADIGFNIDLFNFAACSMGQMGALHDLPTNVKYATASPSFSYTADLDVHLTMARKLGEKNLTGKELGETYVDDFISRLNNHSSDEYASTKTLYDISEKRSFVDSFAAVSNELYNVFSNDSSTINTFKNDIINSDATIQSYYLSSSSAEDPTTTVQKDMIGLLEYFVNNPGKYSQALSNKAETALSEANEFVVYHKYTDDYEALIRYGDINKEQEKYTYKNSKGISLYFGDSESYKYLWFDQETNWFENLNMVYN